MSDANSTCSESDDPRVAILISCYRQAHALDQTLRSILSQTENNWVATVVDDASPDQMQAKEIIEETGDARFKWLSHAKHQGTAATRNTAIDDSRCSLFVCVDAGDRLDATFLDRLVPRMRANEEIDCIFPDRQLFGAEKGVVEFRMPPKINFFDRRDIPLAGALVRKQLWSRLNGFDEDPRLGDDWAEWEFLLRAFCKNCNVEHVSEPIYLRRTYYATQTTWRQHDHQAAEYVCAKHRDTLHRKGIRNEILARGYEQSARSWQAKGDRHQSRKLAFRAWRYKPTTDRATSLVKKFVPQSVAARIGRSRHRYWPCGTRRYEPFFILGERQSDSRSLGQTLANHSQLYIPDQPFDVVSCIRDFSYYGRKRMRWPELVHFIMSQLAFRPELIESAASLRSLVAGVSLVQAKERNLAYILHEFYRFHARLIRSQSSNPRWGDIISTNLQSPVAVRHILEAFPDAQLIHIISDGRTRHILGDKVKNCFELPFEDFVTNPQTVVRELCEFLRVALEPQMVVTDENMVESQ